MELNNLTETISGAPVIGAEQIELLEKLSNACAVSGDEGEVRAIVSEQLKPAADVFKIDVLGNVLATRLAGTARPDGERTLRVLVAAHMDEVGFMLVDGEEGQYRFELVGGIDLRQLPGKPVLVGKDHTPGVIGARPIHLTSAEERKNPITLETLRIDLGLGGNKVKIGDRATFATRFQQIGPSLAGKALDNRMGVAGLIELFKHAPANIELCAVFTTQEEVGARGAHVAAYAYHPDIAIALDATPAYDLPMWDDSENAVYNSRLGYGPAIYVADRSTISDPRLVRHLARTGDALNLPYQFRQAGGGGTDAGGMQLQREGISSISLSVPHRYTHSAISMARLSDWQATLTLLYQALLSLPQDILTQPFA
jgi:putative aminopeptidase FrvX